MHKKQRCLKLLLVSLCSGSYCCIVGCVNWPIVCTGKDEVLDYIKTSTGYVYYCRVSDEKREERLKVYREQLEQ